jgi:hypothetical protein
MRGHISGSVYFTGLSQGLRKSFLHKDAPPAVAFSYMAIHIISTLGSRQFNAECTFLLPIPLPRRSISMGGTTVSRSSHAAGFTLAALFCTTLSQYLSTRQSELYSELLCWLIIPIIFKVQRQLQSSAPNDIGPQLKHVELNYPLPITMFSSHAWLKLTPIWAIALGNMINTVYRTEFLIVELYVSSHHQCSVRRKIVFICASLIFLDNSQ